MSVETREVEIHLTYFKDSGKYYTDAKVTWNCEMCNGIQVVYMPAVCGRVRGMQERKEQLPGLSGSWSGLILVECENGVPCLLLPEKDDTE